MKKRYPAIFLTLAQAATMTLYAAETTMTCEGTSKNYGINAPNEIYFGKPINGDGDVLVIASDKRWAAGLLLNTSIKFSLCEETSTELLYSTHCGVSRYRYSHDWTSSISYDDAHKKMLEKYGEQWASLVTIKVNRMDLTVIEEYLDTHIHTNLVKSKSGKAPRESDVTQTLYLWVSEYRGTCKPQKSKI